MFTYFKPTFIRGLPKKNYLFAATHVRNEDVNYLENNDDLFAAGNIREGEALVNLAKISRTPFLLMTLT